MVPIERKKRDHRGSPTLYRARTLAIFLSLWSPSQIFKKYAIIEGIILTKIRKKSWHCHKHVSMAQAGLGESQAALREICLGWFTFETRSRQHLLMFGPWFLRLRCSAHLSGTSVCSEWGGEGDHGSCRVPCVTFHFPCYFPSAIHVLSCALRPWTESQSIWPFQSSLRVRKAQLPKGTKRGRDEICTQPLSHADFQSILWPCITCISTLRNIQCLRLLSLSGGVRVQSNSF